LFEQPAEVDQAASAEAGEATETPEPEESETIPQPEEPSPGDDKGPNEPEATTPEENGQAMGLSDTVVVTDTPTNPIDPTPVTASVPEVAPTPAPLPIHMNPIVPEATIQSPPEPQQLHQQPKLMFMTPLPGTGRPSVAHPP